LNEWSEATMRVRHKIPSIFNLSMVDVLCCALGCVILLWLINLRDAKQHEDDSGSLLRQKESAIAELEQKRAAVQAQADAQDAALADLKQKWNEATRRVTSLQADLESRGKDLAAVQTDLTARGKDLAASRLRADDLSRKLTDAGGRIKDLQGVADLVPGLRTQLKSAQEQYAVDESKLKTLETDAAARSQDLNAAARKLLASQKDATQRSQELDDASQKLTALQTVRLRLDTDLEDRNKELTLLRPYKDKWSAGQEQMLSLKKELEGGRKELASARSNFDALQTEKAQWRAEAARVRAEAENRFAGITLTGRRVVFLVDISGSMEYLDDNTPAPQKWVAVREIVAKIMRSLPELRKFQVVAFSNKAIFPLGKNGEWLDFDPATSADLVLKTLAAIKPNGGTNMYGAMEAVFRMRPQGLDTVYFCSDGIPNLGEGVTPEEIKADKLTDVEVGTRLGAAVRKKLKTDWNRDLDGKPRVRLNTVGFFYESPDVGAFLWALARENEGSFVGMSKP
jgi:septal ring factor EnvC (AmiA/AmiB activator)